jgi:hypothetical protein
MYVTFHINLIFADTSGDDLQLMLRLIALALPGGQKDHPCLDYIPTVCYMQQTASCFAIPQNWVCESFS